MSEYIIAKQSGPGSSPISSFSPSFLLVFLKRPSRRPKRISFSFLFLSQTDDKERGAPKRGFSSGSGYRTVLHFLSILYSVKKGVRIHPNPPKSQCDLFLHFLTPGALGYIVENGLNPEAHSL